MSVRNTYAKVNNFFFNIQVFERERHLGKTNWKKKRPNEFRVFFCF